MEKRNFNLFTVFCALGLLVLFSCQDDFLEKQDVTDDLSASETANSIEGVVRIKLNEAKTGSLSVSVKSGAVSSNVSNIDSLLNAIGALSFKRTFPYSGKYEERTKEKGLHLWYDITYDTTLVSLNKVVRNFESLSEIDITEPIKSIENEKVAFKKFGPYPLSPSVKSTSTSSSYPYNDTFIGYQWNYYNDGSITDSKEGCDINLYNAWLKQTGSEDVVVAIIDGGIDVDHEDLGENIWTNDSENNGSSDTDDDNNGYKDDVYGYNFVDGSGTIKAEDHGTHVAGTIGAVNNNGKGVCGIAGGTADNPGVKLMSCQVFETDDLGNETSAQSFAEAVKYAADNGAVICQNSWGYDGATYLPASMKAAIDYFNEYAGIDENGDQVGPMAGGVVIFAAGNDALSTNSYPAMYDEVVAVASCGADYTISYYSNYGSWVDITAPGGTDTESNSDYTNWIASTISDNAYAYMVGTSMACPHVSGIAALIVSEYGGDGFTPADLKKKLYQQTTDLDSYNSSYIGLYGAGLINANAVLAASNTAPPEEVTDLTASVASNEVTLRWTVTGDDEEPTGYKIYYSTSSISDEDIKTDLSSLSSGTVLVDSSEIGESMSATISGLQYSTTYYFRIAGYNDLGAYSDYSDEVNITTEENHAPEITSGEGNRFELKSHESKSIIVTIADPDGDSYTWSYSDESGGSSASEVDGGGIEIAIDALSVDPGDYSAMLTATDEYNATSDFLISYTVLENTAPVVRDTIENIYIGDPDNSYVINLDEHFTDEDGESLTYDLTYSASYIKSSLSDQTLTLTPESNGLSTYSITAYDARAEKATITFQFMARDDSEEIDIYPNPVTDVVNFRLGEDVDGDLDVEIYNDNGVLVKNVTRSVSAFSPASADLSELASGQYLLKITYNNQELERNIVKL